MTLTECAEMRKNVPEPAFPKNGKILHCICSAPDGKDEDSKPMMKKHRELIDKKEFRHHLKNK